MLGKDHKVGERFSHGEKRHRAPFNYESILSGGVASAIIKLYTNEDRMPPRHSLAHSMIRLHKLPRRYSLRKEGNFLRRKEDVLPFDGTEAALRISAQH